MQSKTPVGAELGVANHQEGQLYLLMCSGQNPPRKVFQYVAVFILAGAVVGVKFEAVFTKTVVLQMVMEIALLPFPVFTASSMK